MSIMCWYFTEWLRSYTLNFYCNIYVHIHMWMNEWETDYSIPLPWIRIYSCYLSADYLAMFRRSWIFGSSYCYLLDSMKCVPMCGHILYRNLYLFEVCFSLLNWTVRSIHTEPVAEDSMGLPRIFLNNELRELSAYSLCVC